MREWDANGGALPSGAVRSKGACMLSNVSKLLERKCDTAAGEAKVHRCPWDVYESDVRPSRTNPAAL